MALAWVSWTPDRSAFEVETGSNRFYELYLATRPELMKPSFAAQRGPDNWYSTRAESGLLPSERGRALFAPPAGHFGPSKVYFMVKTFADSRGNGPARSPVMGGPDGGVVMTDVDPDADGGKPMESTAVDFEELAARLMPTAAGDGSIAGKGARSAGTRARSARGSSPTRERVPAPIANGGRAAAAGLVRRSGRPASGRPTRVAGRNAALALALTCRELKAAADRDPALPGPSMRSVAEVLSTALAYVPAPGAGPDGPSAAAVCNGACAQRAPYGGRAELVGHIMRAAAPARARSLSDARSREQFLPALAALAPMLMQALPAILPVIMPLIQNLLGGLAKGKSLSGPAASAAAMQQIMAAAPAPAPAPPAGGAPAADPAAAPVAPAVPTPPPSADAAAPAADAAPAVSPDQLAGLLGALQGAEGDGGGLAGLLGPKGGPGHELVKSIVDRLPIEKMFDGQAWIPKSNYDEWRSTLPWDAVLSLSEPTAAVGALFVPGRKDLGTLEGVKLALVERTLTTLPGAGESWIFLSDRPARLRLEVVAPAEGLSRPFVDVRVSRDGSPSGGLGRSVFRLASLAPRERRVTKIELPPELLRRAAGDGSPSCISIRVIQESGARHDAAELRACCHVLAPQTLVLDGVGALEAAPELEQLPTLERVVPRASLGPDLRMVDWGFEVSGRAGVSGVARYAPVGEREVDGERVLEGGLVLSPVGAADLARRRKETDLGAEDMVALADALDTGEALRGRLALRLREEVPPALRAAGGIGIRVEMGWLSAKLVRFTGAGPDGNPSRRDVLPVSIPAARGIALRAA